MKRLLPGLLLAVVFLYADKYNDTLLSIQAKVFPGILMMDTDLEQKLSNGAVSILLLHAPSDEFSAKQFRHAILNHYPDGIGTYPLIVQTGSEIPVGTPPTALIVMQLEPALLEEAIRYAIEQRRLLFAYDNSDLSKGAMVSLYLGKRTAPYLNPQTIKEANIVFKPVLLSISRLLR